MNKYTRAALLTIFLLSFVYAQTPGVVKPTGPTASGSTQVKPKPADHRVQTIPFSSKLVGKTLPYNVLLPPDYDKPAGTNKRFPVLYLLHGLFGHYDNWFALTKLSQYASNYSMIIVTPEGNDAWYTDSAMVASDKYETYIVNELIPDVQRRFRTIETREGRAIAGLSMGGYGALKFGVKYPQMFALAGSMSGAMGAATWTETEMRGLDAIWRTLSPVFGPEGSPTRKANDLNKLYGELTPGMIAALPYVYLDCGTEDPLFSSNRSFVAVLLERKIRHEYRELPGTHAWPYWDMQVQEVLRVAAQKLSAPQTSAVSVAH